jgi:hypothetical protein
MMTSRGILPGRECVAQELGQMSVFCVTEAIVEEDQQDGSISHSFGIFVFGIHGTSGKRHASFTNSS